MKIQAYYPKIILVLLIVLGLSAGSPTPANAQGAVQFYDLEIENHFPDQLIFRARATSPDLEITRAEFAYTSENIYSPESYTVEEIEISTGTEVFLEYTLDTSNFTNPPFMSYSYHWRLELADGSEVSSEEITFRYLDNRYDWQVIENDQIAVWWHDRPDEFGDAIFEISTDAIKVQRGLFQADLENQVLVVINNSSEEFASWHNIAHDWVGGETYTNYGITVQIIESSSPIDSWLYDVIPHEISHLYFDQVTYNPTVSIPVWLNEGVAQYNEFVSHEWVYEQVQSAASQGNLITLSSLERGFGAYDTDRVYLAYYESLSAVSYLVDSYGEEGLSALLAAYKDGITTEDAFLTAIGVSATQFELDWAASLGAVDYFIPTPWPSPAFLPSPTYGTSSGGATPQPEQDKRDNNPLIPCMSIISLLGFGMAGVWYKRNQIMEN